MFQVGNVVIHKVSGLRYVVSEVVNDKLILIMEPNGDGTVGAKLQIANDFELANCDEEMAKEGKCSFVCDRAFIYAPDFCQYCKSQFLQKKVK